MLCGVCQHDAMIVEQFKRLESLAEGRSRSFTDTAESCLIKQLNLSDHKMSSIVKQQLPLRRGTNFIYGVVQSLTKLILG